MHIVYTQFKCTLNHYDLRLLNQQQRKGWWGRKRGMLGTGWGLHMKLQNAHGRQWIWCWLFRAALGSWCEANNFI